MVGLEGDGERVARGALAELQREVEELRRRDERHTRWLDALGAARRGVPPEPGRAAVDNGLDVIVRQTNALDGGRRLLRLGPARGAELAPRAAGANAITVVGASRARALPARRRAGLAGRGRLGRARRPAGPARLGVPVVVAGEPLGMLVFVFADVEPHDEDNRRLLTAVSAAMGFALLRDRLAQELREAAGAPAVAAGCAAAAASRLARQAWPGRDSVGRWLLARRGVGRRRRDRLADDARDLHLRDADALADLRLGEVLLEAQPQDLALARRDRAHEVLERRAVLGQREAELLGAQRVAERVAASSSLPRGVSSEVAR